jgi:hypothetical protein
VSAVAETRVNGREAEICERTAAFRFHLDRTDEDHCDGFATADSPAPLTAGAPVEIKSCRVEIDNGDDWGTTGRWHIHRGSHEELVAAGGYYALIVYRLECNHVVVLRAAVQPAGLVDYQLPETTSRACKLPWTEVFADV